MQCFIILISVILSLTAWGQAPRHKVAVIFSYPKGEWYNGIQRGLTETLTSFAKDRFEIHDYLYDYETLKSKSKNIQELEVNRIVKSISELKADYVVINDDEAVEKFIDKFPAIPSVVLNGINQEPVNSSWSKNRDISKFCGIIEHYPIEESLKMISLIDQPGVFIPLPRLDLHGKLLPVRSTGFWNRSLVS
jgi:hypothetical protein